MLSKILQNIIPSKSKQLKLKSLITAPTPLTPLSQLSQHLQQPQLVPPLQPTLPTPPTNLISQTKLAQCRRRSCQFHSPVQTTKKTTT